MLAELMGEIQKVFSRSWEQIALVTIVILVVIYVLKKPNEMFDVNEPVPGGQCCQGCQGKTECYAYCSPDVVSLCGLKTNDPVTCAKCPMCTWTSGPGNWPGRCVPRENLYLDQASFAWPGYAPWYMNLYFPH